MHIDPELLSLLALGEQDGTAADHVHAQTCAECAGELAELRRVVTLGRSADGPDGLTTPSPELWGRIRAELGFAPEPATLVETESTSELAPEDAAWSRLSAMKAALAQLGRESADEVTAQVTLAPVKASSYASGEAVLSTDELGRRILQVALQADLPDAGLRHAWLVHREDPALRQSLGILDGPFGVWTVDRSIDLQQYGILEISEQQDVGRNEHSGDAIVRGELVGVG